MRNPVLSILLAGLCLLALIASGGGGDARAATQSRVIPVPEQGAHRGPIWETKAVSVRYGRGLEGSERERILVVVRFKNISPVPVPAMNISGFRFMVMANYPYSHDSLDFNRVRIVRPNEEVLVTVSFKNVSQEEQTRVRSLEVREPVTRERLRNPHTWFFGLPPESTLAGPRTRVVPPAGFEGLETVAVRLDRANHGPQGAVSIWLTVRNMSSIPLRLTDHMFFSQLINSASGNDRRDYLVAPAVGEPGVRPSLFRMLAPGADAVLLFEHSNPLYEGSPDNLTFFLRQKPARPDPDLQGMTVTLRVPPPLPTTPPPSATTPPVVAPPLTEAAPRLTGSAPADSSRPSGDILVNSPPASVGDWSLKLHSVTHVDAPHLTGQGDSRLYADLTNRSSAPITITLDRTTSSVLWADRKWGQRLAAEAHVDGRSYGAYEPLTLAPGQSVRLVTTFRVTSEVQRQIKGLEFTIFGTSGTTLTVTAPARDAPTPPPTQPVFTPPAQPAPNIAASSAMRALEGDYVYNESGSLRLRYRDGLLVGEASANGGGVATVTLTMGPQGRLIGTLNQPFQPADATWFAVDLTPSFDGSRLEGSATYVHRPASTPLTFSARRQRSAPPEPTPQPTPQPAPPSGPTSGTGDFQPTAYFDMKVDRVGRTADGSVEVILVVRNTAGDRRGSPYDPQTFSLEGSDGMEYRTDGNHYGQSAEDRQGTTNWIQPGAQGRVTYVFPRVPAGVMPARLILRENGAQRAVFELPGRQS